MQSCWTLRLCTVRSKTVGPSGTKAFAAESLRACVSAPLGLTTVCQSRSPKTTLMYSLPEPARKTSPSRSAISSRSMPSGWGALSLKMSRSLAKRCTIRLGKTQFCARVWEIASMMCCLTKDTFKRPLKPPVILRSKIGGLMKYTRTPLTSGTLGTRFANSITSVPRNFTWLTPTLVGISVQEPTTPRTMLGRSSWMLQSPLSTSSVVNVKFCQEPSWDEEAMSFLICKGAIPKWHCVLLKLIPDIAFGSLACSFCSTVLKRRLFAMSAR
mmetsp:Transcript_81867/g.240317  ORF Transcript_81867/g.240317 Transcript_81867/m.240317 type:complete len:270 (-) Transcript_81867:43-852(-)